MPTITRDQVKVPADVMPEARETYIDNYMKATRGTGRLMLFACDQKIEHLNKDFYGEGIDISDAEPEPSFRDRFSGNHRCSCWSAWSCCTVCSRLSGDQLPHQDELQDQSGLRVLRTIPIAPNSMIWRLFWLCAKLV